MKKCPKCKNEIQENARFCLYCMTSFEEKEVLEVKDDNNRVKVILAVVLAVVLVAGAVFLFVIIGKNSDSPGSANTALQTSSENASEGSDVGTTSASDNTSEGDISVADGLSETEPAHNHIEATSKPTVTDKLPDESPNNSHTESETKAALTDKLLTTKPNNNIEATSEVPVLEEIPKAELSFSFIDATLENTYPKGYSPLYAPESAVVITKVSGVQASGNYIIPEIIDGKKVAAIMPSAFGDSAVSQSVKSVTLPKSVRTVWSNAFEGCDNLTDIYINSSVISISEDAFPETVKQSGNLVIHCARDCRDLYFYYYRNIADKYGAEYEEWNG